MKRTTWILSGLLGITTLGLQAWEPVLGLDVPGIAFTKDYTLDGTLEPDEIPGMASSSDFFAGSASTDSVYDADDMPLSVGGPVRLPQRITAVRTDVPVNSAATLLASSEREIRVEPPKQLRARASAFESGGKYALVQYQSSRRGKKTDAEAKPVVKDEPAETFAGPQLEAEHPDSLRRSIRTVLQNNAKRVVTTQHNSPGDILMMALPYGAEAKVWQPNTSADSRDKSSPKGSYIYSIGTLCWNYACGGKTLLRGDGKRVYAKVGSGYQRRPASLLAMLAMANIMPNYEMKVGSEVYTIENLIATEKLSVSKGTNLSMALVALSFYGDAKESWKNEMGETWSIEKMVVEELNRSIDQGGSDVTDWLLGLTAAVNLYEEEGRAMRGPMALAKKQLGTYQEFVLSVQNEKYLWHPKFFLFKGVAGDNYDTIYAGGHILRWLVLSLPEDQLGDVRVRRAVANLASEVYRIPTNTPVGTLTDRQLEGLAVSLQALSVYHQRAFGEDPMEKPRQQNANAEKSVAVR